MNTKEFVEEIRDRLIRRADGDDYGSYVHGQALSAMRLAFALVEVGEVDEAKEWFRALATTYCEDAEYRLKLRFEDGQPHSGHLPVNSWLRALHAAIMTDNGDVRRQTGERVYQQVTDPSTDGVETFAELDGREKRGRVDTCAALSALMSGVAVDSHVTAIRTHAEAQSAGDAPNAWEGNPFNLPHADLIEGLASKNKSQVAAGVEGLVRFHNKHRRGKEDFHQIEQEVDFVTTPSVVLARSYGYDVEPNSEYIPAAVYDSNHYPLSG